MMEAFRIRPLTEADICMVVEKCGGQVAHPDADRRVERGGDFILGGAAIELKLLDEDGLQKSERQSKLAKLFRDEGFTAPVVVLDRNALSEAGQRGYDRAIEGPIKGAVASARQQLKQTRVERPDTALSVLWVINNGYTALNHEELTALVAHRARNDTSNINGVIVGGCYFHSDGFDSFFLWPLTYVPIRLDDFPAFDSLRAAWHQFAESFMSKVVRGDFGPDPTKDPVLDTQFELHGTTYVKPAPPIGRDSDFFRRGRPRKNSTGLTQSPKIALTFPGLSPTEWRRFRNALPHELGLRQTYADWLRHEDEARADGKPEQPFVRMPVTLEGWRRWFGNARPDDPMRSLYAYANDCFQERVVPIIEGAREAKPDGLLPARCILVVTQEIGQDKANDLSHVAKVQLRVRGDPEISPIVEDLRAFHLHAVGIAAAYAVAEGIDTVMWIRDRKYAWA